MQKTKMAHNILLKTLLLVLQLQNTKTTGDEIIIPG